MVHLMLQPVFMDLAPGASDQQYLTSDELYNFWAVANKAKNSIIHGRRLENLSWRLWYTSTIRGRMQSDILKERETTEFSNDSSQEPDHFQDTQDSNDSTGTTVYSTSSSSESSEFTLNRRQKMPLHRSLLTSTCSSILAEIQDASIRSSSKFLSQGLGQGTLKPTATTAQSPPTAFSPMLARAKSPFQAWTSVIPHSHHDSSNTHHALNTTNGNSSPLMAPLGKGNGEKTRRKKNVDKFLKKFKSNLEGISELFDEKLTFSDDEKRETKEKATEDQHGKQGTQTLPDQNTPQTQVRESKLFSSDFEETRHDNTCTHEESPSFDSKSDFIFKDLRGRSNRRKSLLSQLLEGNKQAAFDDENNDVKSPMANEQPTFQRPRPNFLDSTGSSSFINNQLEIMASARYERFVPNGDTQLTSPLYRLRKSPSVVNSPKHDGVVDNGSGVAISPSPSTSTAARSPTVTHYGSLSPAFTSSRTPTRYDEELDPQVIIW